MSQTIDTRVVEMRFDNKDFESNAKQTMSTLDKLKEALTKTTSKESLSDISKAASDMNLSGIEEGLAALQKRFGAFGTFTGRIIENLADGVTGVMGKALNWVKDSVIGGGIRRAQNIESAHFSLQALLKDEVKVQEIMDNAMTSVDGTAYAYDEAAKAAASFAATGIEGGEQMEKYLKGITGVAAMTNSEYEGISRIFTTVAGNGRLMGDQLLQLSSRGLNAAATIADYFREVRGQTGMTEASIREMVSKGKISFDDFASAMEWAFGESAFRANETFQGALSNMKSAFARIGAEFISPLVAQNSKIVELFNTIRVKTNEFKKLITFGADDVKNSIFGKSFSQQFTDNVLKIADNVSKLIKSLNASAIMKAVYNIRDGFNNLGKAIISWVEPAYRALKKIFGTDSASIYGGMRKVTQAWKDWTNTLKRSDFRVSGLLTGVELQEGWEGILNVVKLLGTAFKGFISALSPIGEIFRSLVTLSISLFGAFGRVLTVISRVGTAVNQTFQPFERLRSVISAVSHAVAVVIETVASLISKFTQFERLNAIFGQLYISGPITKIREVIQNIGTGFDELMEKMQNLTSDQVIAWLDSLGEKFNAFVDYIKEIPMVKNVIEAFQETFQWDNIELTIENVKEKFKQFADYISTNFTFSLEDASTAFQQFKDNVKKAWDWIKKNFENPFADMQINDFINAVIGFGTVWSAFKIADTLKELRKSVMALPDAMTGVLKQLKKTLQSYEKDIDANRLLKVAGAIALMAVAIGTLANVADWKALAAAGLGLAAVAAAILFGMAKLEASKKVVDHTNENLSNALKNLGGDVGQAIKGIIPAIIKPINIMAEAFATKIKYEAMGKYLKDIGKTMLMLVGAIAAIVALAVYHPEELRKAIIVIGAFTAALGVISLLTAALMKSKNATADMATAIQSFSKGFNFKLIASAFKDIGKAVMILVGAVGAVMLLAHINPSGFAQAVVVIGGITAVLFALTYLMPKLMAMSGYGAEVFTRSALTMLAMSGSMMVMVGALSKLMKIEFGEHWIAKLLTFAGIVAAAALIPIAMAAAGKIQDGKIFKAGAALAAVGATMFLIVLALDKLMKIEFTDYWGVRIGILAGILIALYALVRLLGKFSAGKDGGLKGAATILSLAVVIGSMVIALKALAEMDTRGMLKGAISLGLVLAALGLTFKGLSGLNKDVGKTVTNMAVVIGTITAALGVLSIIPFEKLMKGVVSLSLVLLSLSATFKAISRNSGKEWTTALVFVGVLGAVATSLYFLSSQPWQGLLAGALAMDLVLVAVGNMMKKMSKNIITGNTLGAFYASIGVLMMIAISLYFLAEQPWQSLLAGAIAMDSVLLAVTFCMKTLASAKADPKLASEFLIFTISLIPIAFALSLLANYEWQSLVGAAAAIAIAMASIGVTMGILSAIKFSLDDIIQLVLGLAAVAAIGGILSLFANGNTTGMMEAAIAISATLLATAVALGIATLVGSFAGPAIAGAGLFLAFLAVWTLVVVALGAIYDAAAPLINGGIELLTKLGQGIGQFLGAIIEGVLTQVSEALPQLGQDLSDFMSNAQGFFDGLAGINEGTAMAAKAIAQCILYLAAAEIVDALTNWLTGGNSLSDFGEELASFGPKLAQFATDTASVDAEKVQGAAEATERLAQMADSLGKHDGLWQLVTGDNRLDDFGLMLQSYGPKLSAFALTVADVTLDKVDGAAKATERLSEMAKTLENHGGAISYIIGDNTLNAFGEDLMAYGPKLRSFAYNVDGITRAMILGAAQATERLAEMAGNVQNTGGFIGFFTGDATKLTKFGKDLAGYGEGLASFGQSVANLPVSLIYAAADATERLIAVFDEMANMQEGGVAKFNAALKELSLTAIQTLVDNFTAGREQVVEAVNALFTAMIESITTQTPLVVNALTTFCQQFLNTWATRSEEMKRKFKETGKKIMEEFKKGMESKRNDVMNWIKKFCKEVINTFDQNLPRKTFFDFGARSIQEFIRGLESERTNAVNKAKQICDEVLDMVKSFIEKFFEPGQQSAQRYIEGINSKQGDARTAGERLAEHAANGAKEKGYNAFYEAGARAAEGMSAGIDSKASSLLTKARNLAEQIGSALNGALKVNSPSKVTMETGKAVDEGLALGMDKGTYMVLDSVTQLAKFAVNALEEALDDDFGLDPVITPYLDLSQINQDVQSLNNMLENGSVGMRSNVGTFSDRNGSTFNFTQNNYSPTALSRAEIYRQTNNQFSRLRGLVSVV